MPGSTPVLVLLGCALLGLLVFVAHERRCRSRCCR
jgi:hypothetical protein